MIYCFVYTLGSLEFICRSFHTFIVCKLKLYMCRLTFEFISAFELIQSNMEYVNKAITILKAHNSKSLYRLYPSSVKNKHWESSHNFIDKHCIATFNRGASVYSFVRYSVCNEDLLYSRRRLPFVLFGNFLQDSVRQ